MNVLYELLLNNNTRAGAASDPKASPLSFVIGTRGAS